MPSDLDGLARTLDAQAREVRAFVRDVAKDAAKVAREEHRTTAAAATGGDGRYSNFKGPKLDVKARYRPNGVDIAPSGPWKIAEEGAAPHSIKPKGKRLKINGQVRSGPVNHPGTKGSKAWTRAEKATVDRLDRDIPKGVDDAMERGFRAG